MNHKAILSAVIAAGLVAGGPAFGQGHDHWDDHGHDMHTQHGNPHGNPHDDHHDRHADNWGHDGRGAGPRHDFHRGGHLPREYRNRQYVVNDWRGHHLHVPPRGYQWVQTGGDYVLVAIGTGIIAQIVLGN